jgi:uroporphyrinogen-III decarboxylase
MSEIVDIWVDRLRGKIEPIGKMTHWERLSAAFDRKPTDLIPVAPELDYWQVTYAGYGHDETFNDIDKTTDACIKTWADLRTDAIWMYVDLGHQLEPMIPPEKRKDHIIVRGKKDYVLFHPIADTLDQAIEIFEKQLWTRYGDSSRAVTHYTPHMLQLLEFQEKMDRIVPIIVGAATPINQAETVVGVEKFVKWLITEDKVKMKHYLDLVLLERLAALDFYRDFAAKNGCAFFCLWGGARTWGPRQLDEFGYPDRIFAEKAAQIFPYTFVHHCGKNLPKALELIANYPAKAVQYDEPYYSMDISWRDWCETVAKIFSGKKCAMNAPTTQQACFATVPQIENTVREFIQATIPYTTAVVMPGCEIDSYAPVENVKAMINAARSFQL